MGRAKGLFVIAGAMMVLRTETLGMKYTDIAIVGGGLAGSTTAAMLGRAGISAILIDPHPVYPPDFRVEKLSGSEQVERFRKTGIADAALRAATHDGENWIARFGYLLDKRPSQQYGIMYDALVNAIRAADFRRHRINLQQGDIHFGGPGAAKTGVVEWRGNFRAPRRARQRIECRAAPPAWNRTPDCQRVPLDFARIRYRSGRSRRLRFSGDHLLLGANERPDCLSVAVPDREPDAGQPVCLSPDRRSLAAANAPRSGADAKGLAAAAWQDHRRIRDRRRRQDPACRPLCQRGSSPARHGSGRRRLCRRAVRSPEPAPTRCSRTSNGCATSIFRTGSQPTAWTKQDRGVLRRSGQDRLRRLVEREGLQFSLGVDR